MVATYTKPAQSPVQQWQGTYQLPLPLFDATAVGILTLLEQMVYDDALEQSTPQCWRLEYLYLDSGLPHYRLYQGDALFGIVDIRHPSQIPVTQLKLVLFLAGLGFTSHNTRLIPDGRQTADEADKRGRRLPLVMLSDEQQASIQEQKGSLKYEARWSLQLRYLFVARKPCGCVYGAIMDTPMMKPIIRHYMTCWQDAGMSVERVEQGASRRLFKRCECSRGQVKRENPFQGRIFDE